MASQIKKLLLNVRLSSLVASSPFPKASGAQSSFSNGYRCSNSINMYSNVSNNYIKVNNQNYIRFLLHFGSLLAICLFCKTVFILEKKKNNRKCRINISPYIRFDEILYTFQDFVVPLQCNRSSA